MADHGPGEGRTKEGGRSNASDLVTVTCGAA